MHQKKNIPLSNVNSSLRYRNSYNEMFQETGILKSEYESVVPFVQTHSSVRLKNIQKKIDFVLKEQGITFGESRPTGYIERPWYLDMIPHIIMENEFSLIESGIKQRITALNYFLNDIYSDQNILKEKIIPKEIVLGDPNYLRQCVGVKVPKNIYLHIGAFDIIRSENGDFLIIDDNLTIPSGISYAITNRIVLRQQFPMLFQNNLAVKPVWDTTAVMLSRLKECAPSSAEDPLVVLLSPGIYNVAYSDHKLIANRMGIPLVLPKDLIVKDNQVFMKTVGGLKRIDVIYRRIEDYYIDPVSFYQDSVLGVPGLLSCVRHGSVTVANAIGCGVASSKCLMSFSDDMIKFYLSEEPILKSVETYLLDNSRIMNHVFANLDEFVVKPTQGSGGFGILLGPESSRSEIENVKQTISRNPYSYVAQPLIPLSHEKIFTTEGLRDRYVETRFYSFLGEKFSLSNSVLTRVSPAQDTLMVCNSMGGGSKDTWVLGRSEPIVQKVTNFQTARNFVLSRVAESLFWLGRYVNRCLTTANVLQVAYSSEIDVLLGNEDPSYRSLVKTISKLTGSPMRLHFKESDPWHISFFQHAVGDKKNPYSLASNVNYAMYNAREIQNYLSNDMWVSLRKLLEYMSELPGSESEAIRIDDLSEWLGGVVHYSQSFYGASLDTFSRQDILQFIQLGRYIEHCYSIITVIKSTIQFLVKYCQKEESTSNLQPFIIVILKILNSYEAYQWSYQSNFDPYLAYRMLIVDKSFNNSLVSCIEKIKSILSSIGQENESPGLFEETPEYLCDILMSRAFSFNLKDNLIPHGNINNKTKKSKEFHYVKGEVKPGFWALHLKAGIEILGGKIMDRYSNIASPTPFTIITT